MGIADNISSSVDEYQAQLESKFVNYLSQLSAYGSFDMTKSLYDKELYDAQNAITVADAAINDSIIKFAPSVDKANAALINQGAIGTQSFEIGDYYKERIKNYSNILSNSDKNLDGFTFEPLSAWDAPIWKDYDVNDGDFFSAQYPVVSEKSFVDYVFMKEQQDKQSVNDEILAANAKIASRGFMYPNSASGFGIQLTLVKYINTISDRSREVWEKLASRMNMYLNDVIGAAIDRVNYNLEFNKQYASLTKEIADAFAKLQGLLNDIRIKQFSLEEEQAVQYAKNVFTQGQTIYKSYIATEQALYEVRYKEIMSKWELEAQRIVAEVNALQVNVGGQSTDLKFIVNEYNAKVQSLYEGLSKDIASFEASFTKNQKGLADGIDYISKLAQSAAQAVVGVVQKKE
jgi:hypothetical protein